MHSERSGTVGVNRGGRDGGQQGPSPVLLHFGSRRRHWNASTRVLFRFSFVYLSVYIAAYPFAGLLGPESIQAYQNFWLAPAVWIGRHLLHCNVTLPVRFTGSGDKPCDYLFVFCLLGFAAIAAAIWSTVAGRRSPDERLFGWLRLSVRIALGVTLLVYGAAKVFPSQFPAPLLHQLVKPYGDSTPIGLLWIFMGTSSVYSAFAGSLEMLAGLLLFLPGVTTLGALLSLAVLSHVFALNLSYDVPVKLLSFHLLLMSVFLVLPDAVQLLKLFVLRAEISLKHEPLLVAARYRRIVTALTMLFGLFIAVSALLSSYQSWQLTRTTATMTPFYGIWSVEEFISDGRPRPPLLSDGPRWRRLFIESPHLAVVEPIEGPQQVYLLTLDKLRHTVTLGKSGHIAQFTFANPRPDFLTMAGTMDGHAMSLSLHRIRQPQFALTSHTFHWITDIQ